MPTMDQKVIIYSDHKYMTTDLTLLTYHSQSSILMSIIY